MTKSILFALLSFIFIVSVNGELNHLQSWQTLWTISESATNRLSSLLDNQLTPVISSAKISSSCQQSLFKVINGIKQFDINYVRMYDSWGKLPSGLLFGSWTDLGSLDQCVSLEESQYCLLTASMPLPPKRSAEGLFRPLDKSSFNLTDPLSTYLYPHVHYFHNVNLTFGLCLPRQCSPLEMTTIVESWVHSKGLQMKVDVDLCQHRAKSGNPILFREYIALAIVTTVIGLNIIGTLFPSHPILGHFNLYLNWSKLFSTNNNENTRSYPFLECYKFFAMLYIVIGHVGWALNYGSFHSMFKVQASYNSFLGYSLLPGYLASEVYFLITGLELMTFFLNFNGQFTLYSAITFLVVRWARFFVLIGFNVCLYILIFSNHVRDLIGGPFWSHLYSASSIPDTCAERWYSHLFLYTHLFADPDNWNLCIMPDWFLQVDFVLAFLFLIVLWPLRKSYKRLSISLAIFFALLGPLLLGSIIYYKSTSPTWLPFNFVNQELAEYLAFIHSKPFTHMSPYFVGILLAFALQPKEPIISKQIHKRLMWLLWLVCNFIVFGYEVVTNYNLVSLPYAVDIIYASFSRLVWSIVYAWPMYCLHYRFVSDGLYRFTCAGFFKPMSRINLTLLFMNEIMLRLRNGTQNYVSNLTVFDILVNLSAPVVLFSYLFSIIISPMIDGPSISLVKSYFKRQEDYDDCMKKSSVNNNNNTVMSNGLVNGKKNN
ncbi:uncharacterized protein LOC107359137 [Tetranychus urticae]|uniref:Nose resistant-to-fluoxetine protein N-terminal domain-containing protein n=1 Tax=Tetranychus urticae TaxID=32264 RepID=T1K0I4_TETUR|nr:uncharacterized protein LOC107359137 [Tetranychus urticae]